MKRLLNFIPLLFLLYSCRNENNSIKKVEVTENFSNYIIDIDKAHILKNFREAIDEIEFIPLETNENSLIAEVEKVVLHKDMLYVLDKKYSSLKVFDKQGKYIRSIGGIGHGPGEFTTLWDFNLDLKNEKLLLWSNNEQSIFEYDLEGNYIKTIRSNVYGSSFAKIDDTWYYYIDHTDNHLSMGHNLIVMNSAGKVEDRLFPFPKTIKNMFSDYGIMYKNHEGVLYSSAFSDTVFQIDANREIYPKYIFDFGKNALPASARNSSDNLQEVGLNHAYLRTHFVESEEILAFTYLEKYVLRSAFCYKKRSASGNTDNILIPITLNYPLRTPVGLTGDNKIISLIGVDTFLSWAESKEKIVEEDVKRDYPDLYNLIPSLEHTDNPILVLYKMKTPLNGFL